MKTLFKRLFLCFCVIALLFSSIGCNFSTVSKSGDINEVKQSSINKIDNYLQEIYQMNLPYSLVLIEYEAKTAKQAIQNSFSLDEVVQITCDSLNEMHNLIAPDFLYDLVKESRLFITDYYEIFSSDYYMKYYLGSRNGYYYVVLKGILYSRDGIWLYEEPPKIWGWTLMNILVYSTFVYTEDRNYVSQFAGSLYDLDWLNEKRDFFVEAIENEQGGIM